MTNEDQELNQEQALQKELQEYREFIQYLSKTDSPALFGNKSPEHATIVLSEIIRRSKKNVIIFAGKLYDTVGKEQEYLDALKSFLDQPESHLKIILNNFDKAKAYDSKLYNLLNSYRNNVELKTTDKIIYENTDETRPKHFTIGDGKSIRLETNDKEKQAICSMNCKSIAEGYVKVFNKLFSSKDYCESVDISSLCVQ